MPDCWNPRAPSGAGELLDLGVRSVAVEFARSFSISMVDVERAQQLSITLGAHQRDELVTVLLDLGGWSSSVSELDRG